MNTETGKEPRSIQKSKSIEPKKKNYLFKLSVLLLTTLVMLMIMEITLQLVVKIRDGKWLFQRPVTSKVGYTKIIKERRKFTLKPGFSNRKKTLVIDDMGFRKGPYPVDPDKKFIINAGDSMAFGPNLANDETYPYHLARLAKKRNIPVNVINSGIPSYNLWQSFDRLRQEVFPRFSLSRVAVITMQAANDVFLLSYYRDRWFPEITWAERRFIRKIPLEHKIATLHYGKQVIEKLFGQKTKQDHRKNRMVELKKRLNQKYHNYEGVRKKYDQYQGGEMLEMVRETLYRELRFYQDYPVHIILMPIDPFYYQLSNVEKNPSLKKWKNWQFIVKAARNLIFQFNDLLREVSEDFDRVHFFDTRPVLDAGNRDETHGDHVHYSDQGNKVIARALLDFMIEKKLLPE